MQDSTAVLILTRPKARSLEFLERLNAKSGKKFLPILAPLLEIRPTDAVPTLDNYRTVILTSSSAVAIAGDALAGKSVLTVGKVTASLASQAHARAQCGGEDVDALVKNAAEISSPAIHLRGTHTRGQLVARLQQVGVAIDEAVIYDQVALPLSDDAKRAIESEQFCVIPLFSPRTAAILNETVSTATNVHIVAMSAAVAAEWHKGGKISIADQSTAESMCDATLGAI